MEEMRKVDGANLQHAILISAIIKCSRCLSEYDNERIHLKGKEWKGRAGMKD